jgi:hypothetical protein
MTLRHLAPLLIALALLACDPAAPSGDAGTDARRVEDSGLPLDAGPTIDTGVDAPAEVQGGFVRVEVSESGMGALSAAFGGRDQIGFPRLDISGCARRDAGDCHSLVCPSTLPPPEAVSAGTLTLGVDGSAPLDVAPDAMGHYTGTTGPVTSGTELTASASGAVVPAFSLAVTVPAAPVATLPTTISMASDLVVTWDAAVAAEEVVFFVGGTSGRGAAICFVPASQGTVTMGSSLLADVGAGPALTSLRGVATTPGMAGTFDLTLHVEAGTGVLATITD